MAAVAAILNLISTKNNRDLDWRHCSMFLKFGDDWINGATCRDLTDKQTDRQKNRQTVVTEILGVFRQVMKALEGATVTWRNVT